jgi:hypothetical protein
VAPFPHESITWKLKLKPEEPLVAEITALKALYETLLQELRHLKNCSPKTLRSYG